MATKTFNYISRIKLSCVKCIPADIVVCVTSPDYLSLQECGEETNHFEAILIEACQLQSGTCCGTWQYTIQYDDSVLAEGHELTSCDISGIFCKSCLTQWVEDKLACCCGGQGGIWGEAIYGSGEDGDRTVNEEEWFEVLYHYEDPFPVDFNVTRTLYYNSLTIGANGILHPWGNDCYNFPN